MDPDDRSLGLFLEVYGDTSWRRAGGGEHTLRALGSVPEPPPQTVLDLGCGPGAQSVALASVLTEARVVAVDFLPSMVEEANCRFTAAGFGDRVVAQVGDMEAPPVDPGTQDLFWCEAAIYNLGVTEALTAWRPLLGSRGSVAFTEPVWLVESPPKEIHDWWSSEYPAISDRLGVEARIEAASYRTVASFVLPASAWWQEYDGPMQDRIAALEQLPDDSIAGVIVAAARAEIGYFRRFSECKWYAFFIPQPMA